MSFLDHRNVIGSVPYDMANVCMYVCMHVCMYLYEVFVVVSYVFIYVNVRVNRTDGQRANSRHSGLDKIDHLLLLVRADATSHHRFAKLRHLFVCMYVCVYVCCTTMYASVLGVYLQQHALESTGGVVCQGNNERRSCI